MSGKLLQLSHHHPCLKFWWAAKGRLKFSAFTRRELSDFDFCEEMTWELSSLIKYNVCAVCWQNNAAGGTGAASHLKITKWKIGVRMTHSRITKKCADFTLILSHNNCLQKFDGGFRFRPKNPTHLVFVEELFWLARNRGARELYRPLRCVAIRYIQDCHRN